MYDWGPIFIAWTVTIFTVTALLVVGGVVALIVDGRRHSRPTTSGVTTVHHKEEHLDAERLTRL